ncbi:O-antigen ligase family protein [Viridibacillus arvi]|uniref:O-antigen ligase family protein n=1 Tax=Viridibacillus arvi TaxID=263475 RepID=UPI003CFFBD62
MAERLPSSLLWGLFLAVLLSSIVMFEPAPTDILMVIVTIIAVVYGVLRYSASQSFGVFCILLLLLANILSLFFVQNAEVGLFYFIVTLYLSVMWFGIVGLGGRYFEKVLTTVIHAYVFTAIICAILGLAVYFQIIPIVNDWLLFGRVKLFFKDPNVYGPFIVLPSIYAILRFEQSKRFFWLCCFFVLVSGVTISFSRAAWLNLVISIVIYLIFAKQGERINRIKLVFGMAVISILLLIFYTQFTGLDDQLSDRMSLQHYDNDRFAMQKEALITGLKNPIGIGPGQSEILFPLAPHNLYARILTENGFLGFTSFCAFLIVSIIKSFQSSRQLGSYSSYYVMISAVIIGHVANSFFIDSLHWRHLWLILALAWIPIRLEKEG